MAAEPCSLSPQMQWLSNVCQSLAQSDWVLYDSLHSQSPILPYFSAAGVRACSGFGPIRAPLLAPPEYVPIIPIGNQHIAGVLITAVAQQQPLLAARGLGLVCLSDYVIL